VLSPFTGRDVHQARADSDLFTEQYRRQYHQIKMKQSGNALGRPRSFDIDKALEAAMIVFWCKGYEGASLTDLTKAMGINRPSLYAAFGDKNELFRKALDRYEQGPASYVREALNQPTALAAVEHLLQGAVDLNTAPGNPRGCLLHGGLSCAAGAEDIRRELISRRAAGEKAVYRRLNRARADGDLPQDANPADLARYIVTLIQGIAVQAADGATRGELRRVIQTALQAWPK
jgi:AcrR family transcriptional regulator